MLVILAVSKAKRTHIISEWRTPDSKLKLVLPPLFRSHPEHDENIELPTGAQVWRMIRDQGLRPWRWNQAKPRNSSWFSPMTSHPPFNLVCLHPSPLLKDNWFKGSLPPGMSRNGRSTSRDVQTTVPPLMPEPSAASEALWRPQTGQTGVCRR
jgi:hypothetical protein